MTQVTFLPAIRARQRVVIVNGITEIVAIDIPPGMSAMSERLFGIPVFAWGGLAAGTLAQLFMTNQRRLDYKRTRNTFGDDLVLKFSQLIDLFSDIKDEFPDAKIKTAIEIFTKEG